jgi:hypothetical protein
MDLGVRRAKIVGWVLLFVIRHPFPQGGVVQQALSGSFVRCGPGLFPRPLGVLAILRGTITCS